MDPSSPNPYLPPQPDDTPPPPPGFHHPLKDPLTLARWACGLYAGSTLLALLIHLIGTFASEDDLNAGGSPILIAYGLGSLAAVALIIASGIVYLCWKYRAATNARTLDPLLMNVSPGLAIGSYFIPFANLVLPYKAMSAIARISKAGTGLVGLWWTLHLLASFVSIAVIRTATESDRITAPSEMEHFSVILDLVSTLVAITLVMQVTRAQSALARATPPR